MGPVKFTILIGSFALTACTTLPHVSEKIQADASVYRDVRSAFSGNSVLATHRYRAVLIDSFTLAANGARTEHPQEAAELAAELEQALLAGIEPAQLTTQTGPGVLRLKVVIKDVDPSSPVLNIVSSLIAFVPLDTGGIAADIHLMDSRSDALLATIAANEKVTPLHIAGSFSRYGHAKSIVEKWGRELTSQLETAEDAAVTGSELAATAH